MNWDRLWNDTPWIVWPILAFILTVVFTFLFRPRTKQLPSPTTQDFDDRARLFDTSASEAESQAFLAEKRKTLRREGNPIPIRLSRDLEGERAEEAFVVDRSKTGLQIWCKRWVAKGALVRVKADNAPEGTPWILVQVCRVGQNRKFYELGCQFTQDVPWNVLLLFG